MTRVVVTGIGVVSPVGNNPTAFWSTLVAGQSGVGPITLFDVSAFPIRIGGEVKALDLAEAARQFPQAVGERDRKVWLGLTAAKQAVADACLENGTLADAQIHVGVSLESFSLEDLTPAAQAQKTGRGLAQVLLAGTHGQVMQTPLDRLADLIANSLHIRGSRWTNCSACAAGAQAVGEGLHAIRAGDCELALVGAADSMLNPLGLGGFSLLRILSSENDNAAGACRPFDATREGTVLGEGGGFLVLENLDHARHRGARIYAEVLGYGSSMDAFRVSDPVPDGRGAMSSMRRAIADAGLTADQIDCVNAHGTGTPKNDVVETAAIKEVLGPRARQIPVTAVKSMTGHMIAASGTVEAVASVLTLHNRVVPPTINLRTPDPECDLDYVAEGARPFTGRTVLSNSFGFGGQNATLIFARSDEAL